MRFSPGQQITTLDAGMSFTGSGGSGVISDYVWTDTDNDGIQDAGESGKDGVTVNLRDGIGTLLNTTTTSGGGQYSFTGLGAGTYMVEFVLPSGFTFSPKDQGGNDATDSDANTSTGLTDPFPLSARPDPRHHRRRYAPRVRELGRFGRFGRFGRVRFDRQLRVERHGPGRDPG